MVIPFNSSIISFPITYSFVKNITADNILLINQTVDAEIKVIMIPQRAGDAENPAENKSSNGPLRVQSNAEEAKYSAT